MFNEITQSQKEAFDGMNAVEPLDTEFFIGRMELLLTQVPINPRRSLRVASRRMQMLTKIKNLQTG